MAANETPASTTVSDLGRGWSMTHDPSVEFQPFFVHHFDVLVSRHQSLDAALTAVEIFKGL